VRKPQRKVIRIPGLPSKQWRRPDMSYQECLLYNCSIETQTV